MRIYAKRPPIRTVSLLDSLQSYSETAEIDDNMSTLNEYLLHKSKNDKLHESSVGFSSPSPGTGTCENAPCQGHDGMNTSEPIFHKCNESLEPIAIVGMAFRFPGGAVTEDALWDMLLEKRCASSKFPSDRINIDAFHCPEGKRPNTVC